LGGEQKGFGGNFFRMPPVSAGLGRTVPRKSSIGSLHVCAGGVDILTIYFYFTTWTRFADCANYI